MPHELAIQELRDSMSHLRGGLFEAVELIGLSTKQENGIKGLVRRLTYEAQTTIEAAIRQEI